MFTSALRRVPALLLLSVALLASSAQAQTTFIVTKTADTQDGTCDADCSLREAINAANINAGADILRFGPSLTGQTIVATNSFPLITEDVTIDGSSQNITILGDGTSGTFFLIGQGQFFRADVTIIGLTITGGVADSGGGLLVFQQSSLTLIDCVVSGNEARPLLFAGGGGIINSGTLTLIRTTVSSNSTNRQGGGIYNSEGATLTVRNSTISGNTAGGGDFGGGGGIHNAGTATITYSTISGNSAGRGGGIRSEGPETAIANSTVAANDANATGGGLLGPGFRLANSIVAGNTVAGGLFAPTANCDTELLASEGFNLTSIGTGCLFNGLGDFTDATANIFTNVLDPTLQDNGGPTLTHALLAKGGAPDNNPAVELGGLCGPTDQRGFPAPVDGDADGTTACDAGAVERADASTPDLTIRLETASEPLVIPATGGPASFIVTITNMTDEEQSAQAWSEATLPNGMVRGPLLGPVTLFLGPGQTVSRSLVQDVPGTAPPGDYVYTGLVGNFPDGVFDSDRFLALKQATGRASETVLAWSVVDAATGEAITANTLWTSDHAPEAASLAVPEVFALAAAYPNPFQTTTALTLDVPHAQRVQVAVYDVLGRAVATLVDGELEAGRRSLAFDGSGLPSGVYLVRMETDGFAAMQRATLVR